MPLRWVESASVLPQPAGARVSLRNHKARERAGRGRGLDETGEGLREEGIPGERGSKERALARFCE